MYGIKITNNPAFLNFPKHVKVNRIFVVVIAVVLINRALSH